MERANDELAVEPPRCKRRPLMWTGVINRVGTAPHHANAQGHRLFGELIHKRLQLPFKGQVCGVAELSYQRLSSPGNDPGNPTPGSQMAVPERPYRAKSVTANADCMRTRCAEPEPSGDRVKHRMPTESQGLLGPEQTSSSSEGTGSSACFPYLRERDLKLYEESRGSWMAIRLKDIAADVGVSTITVSKVLRNKPDVGEETRKRVLQRVAELKYRPNLLARGLASGRSDTVGLIVPDLVHTFFAEFAKGLKAGLRKRGYQLVLASAEEEPEEEVEEIHNLLARGVDALLVASCQTRSEGLGPLLEARLPFILIDRAFGDLASHFVGTDDFAAGSLATEHLLSLGRRRIAHLGNREGSPGEDRFRGYKEALQLADIPLAENLIVRGARLEEAGDKAGYEAMATLLKAKKRPDAVFCYNDLSAVGAIKRILAAGVRVPEDIAVIGCGNLRLATYLEVPLSSVDQDTPELGEQAAKLTAALLSGASSPGFREIRVAPRVVARASTLGTG